MLPYLRGAPECSRSGTTARNDVDLRNQPARYDSQGSQPFLEPASPCTGQSNSRYIKQVSDNTSTWQCARHQVVPRVRGLAWPWYRCCGCCQSAMRLGCEVLILHFLPTSHQRASAGWSRALRACFRRKNENGSRRSLPNGSLRIG
jgi:hypothetical protein